VEVILIASNCHTDRFVNEAHSWLQYSKRGTTSAVEIVIIDSISLVLNDRYFNLICGIALAAIAPMLSPNVITGHIFAPKL
jgi:hypothetical protein